MCSVVSLRSLECRRRGHKDRGCSSSWDTEHQASRSLGVPAPLPQLRIFHHGADEQEAGCGPQAFFLLKVLGASGSDVSGDISMRCLSTHVSLVSNAFTALRLEFCKTCYSSGFYCKFGGPQSLKGRPGNLFVSAPKES